MTINFQNFCTRISDSILKMPFQWTSIWMISNQTPSIITTKGDLWATKVLSFHDDNLYGGPRKIKELMRDEYVSEARIEKTLTGPRLIVVTRHDT